MQVEVLPYMVKQIPQPPQIQVLLRRFTRERRFIVLRDYIYLREHEFDIGFESDHISLHEVKQCSNLEGRLKP